MAEPRFSIVITCHNQRDYVRKAVDSALAQAHVRDVIVVDDASTDGSLAILQSYGTAIRLLCLSKNLGCIAARNEGATRARGEYIMFLDGDDYLSPWTTRIYEQLIVEKQPKIIIANPHAFSGEEPEPSVTAPRAIEFVEYKKLIDRDRPRAIYPSFALERKMFERVGRWTPGIFHLDLEDLCMKMAGEGPTLMICAPETFYYRIHAANSIHAISPFLKKLRLIISKTNTGKYPAGGAGLRFLRYAWLGNTAKFWIKSGWRKGLHQEAIRTALPAAIPVLCATLRRIRIQFTGRRPIMSVAFDSSVMRSSSTEDRADRATVALTKH
jgi:glycosyltransferase involved in cell wall biosynthesis